MREEYDVENLNPRKNPYSERLKNQITINIDTSKEIVNLIRILKEKGMSSDEILAIIEFIETHDPKEQE